MTKVVSRWLKRKVDDAFHKVFGHAEGGVTLNVRQDFHEQDPSEVARVFQRDLLKSRVAPLPAAVVGACGKRHELVSYPGSDAWGEIVTRGGALPPPYPNLAEVQDDAKAAAHAHEAVRLAVDWGLGVVPKREDTHAWSNVGMRFGELEVADNLNEARRQLAAHQAHLARTKRFAGEFKPNEEGVYVALLDLVDAETNGLDRAHGYVRRLLSNADYARVRDDYAELDAQANSDWQEVLEDRRAKLRVAVGAFVGDKPVPELPRPTAVCRACGEPLVPENSRVADGCPCNSPRGVNHGLVPAGVCACDSCLLPETSFGTIACGTDKGPPGWWCSRKRHHVGPCAARQMAT